MFLHVSAYKHHNQGAHKILTGYLYVGVHYKKDNGVSSKSAPVRIVKLWIQVIIGKGHPITGHQGPRGGVEV
jgi:hypothetical protein